MKKLIIAAIALVGISAAGVAQTTNNTSKTKDKKMQIGKPAAQKKQTPSLTPGLATQKPLVNTTVKKEEKKPVASAPAVAKATNMPVKKTGSSSAIHTKASSSNTGHTALHHTKKDGTADKRYKENKRHS